MLNINDDAIMKSALRQANEGNYFEALTLFARVDTYESRLNQIACYCNLGDTNSALRLFCDFFSRYGRTHNIYEDLSLLGATIAKVKMMAFRMLGAENIRRSEDRIDADKSLVAQYAELSVDDLEFFTNLIQEHEQLTQEDDAPQSEAYDVNDEDYPMAVLNQMQRERALGNHKKADELEALFLSFDRDDATVLDMQSLIAMLNKDIEGCLRFAAHRARVTDPGDPSKLYNAVYILFEHDRTEDLPTALNTLYSVRDQLTCAQMVSIAAISANIFGYNDMTLDFCDEMYSREAGLSFEVLEMCAIIYYNSGRVQDAREATLLMLRAEPNNGVAQVLLEYINAGEPPMEVPYGKFLEPRIYDVPKKLSDFAQRHLPEKPAQATLTKDQWRYIEVLLYDFRGCNVKAEVARGEDIFSAVGTCLTRVAIAKEDIPEFHQFLKSHLCDLDAENLFNTLLIEKLLETGYRDVVNISCYDRSYTVDFSPLKEVDRGLRFALATTASSDPVDCAAFAENYPKLVKTLGLTDKDVGRDSAFKIAYALFAMSDKDFDFNNTQFLDSKDSEYYDRYVKATQE